MNIPCVSETFHELEIKFRQHKKAVELFLDGSGEFWVRGRLAKKMVSEVSWRLNIIIGLHFFFNYNETSFSRWHMLGVGGGVKGS